MELNYRFIIRKREKKGGVSYQLILSYKTKDGEWKQKSKGGYALRSLAASDKEKEKLLAEVKKTGDIDPLKEGMTLREFSDFYLSGRKDLAQNSIRFHQLMIRTAGALSDKPMMDITYADVYQKLQSLPNAEATKRGWIRTMKHLFREAVRYHVVGASPISELMYRPRMDEAGEGSKLRTFTEEEIRSVLDYLYTKNIEAWILMYIAAYTGARIGEVLALTIGDIDFKHAAISFNKQLAFVAPKQMGIKRMKSKNSSRTVPIPPMLCQALAEYRERRLLYFHGRLTRYYHSNNLVALLRRVCPSHTLHDFRHTYATRLLASGMDIKTVASLLGDTVATVEKVYVHYTDEMREKAADDISRIFG